MTLLDIDWDQQRPSEADLDACWAEVEIAPPDLSMPPPVETYCDALRDVKCNGGVTAARFTIPRHHALSFWLSRNNVDECELIDRLLAHPSAAATLPELMQEIRPVEDLAFQNPLMLDGLLARELVSGGAYKGMEARKAKRLGVDAMEAIIEGRYGEFLIYETRKPWSAWFCDVAWDWSLFILDKRRETLLCLFATDTD